MVFSVDSGAFILWIACELLLYTNYLLMGVSTYFAILGKILEVMASLKCM